MAIRATTSRRLLVDAIWKPFKQILVQILEAIPSEKWEHVFVISCIAVSLDPLFFYIPIIDETHKCLAMDKKMRTVALILRSLTDIPLLIHIKDQIWNSKKIKTDYPNLADSDTDSDAGSNSNPRSSSDCASRATSWCSLKNMSIIINCLVIVPIPQVAIIVGFFGTRGSSGTRVFIQRTIINVALVLQYLPRVAQIYLSSKKFRMSGKWIKPSLNLFLYLLASHIFAAFWYFFAIQRETSCWHQACRHTPGCVATFDCNSVVGSPPLSISVINQLCPIHSPDKTKFDFGIYLEILQSGNTGSVNFLTKLFYSLWWGLKNLSNFGTNLQTSTYMWENCFTILICISGLLLFLYLIGNMQKYMELETTKFLNAEESRRKKIKAKRAEIKAWMTSNSVPESLQSTIKEYTKEHKVVEKNLKADVDVKYFLNDGIVRIRALKLFLVKNAIKDVPLPMLRNMHVFGLKKLCRYMKAEVYKENEYIVNDGHHVKVNIIFIIQGEIEFTNTVIPNNVPKFSFMKGDYHEESIVSWVLQNYKKSYYDPLPVSTGRVICRRKVEALVLNALDLIRFIKENLRHLNLADTTHDITNQIPNEESQDDQLGVETWKRPEPGHVKLNCSVEWDPDTKLAASGCVCRDDKGAFMAAESRGAIKAMDRFFAEASSIRAAIDFCRKKINLQGKEGIMVESDNQGLIECLNDHKMDSNERISDELRPVLVEIVYKSAKVPTIYFMHCKHQSNAAAKCIAVHAVGEHDPSSWNNSAPEWLDPILDQDSPNLDEKSPSTSEQNQELVGTVLDIVID